MQYAGMSFSAHAACIGDVDVFKVQKLHHSEWVDWVIVAQSSVEGAGRGVFAARAFRRWEFIGRYLGFVLGFRADFTDAVLKVCTVSRSNAAALHVLR